MASSQWPEASVVPITDPSPSLRVIFTSLAGRPLASSARRLTAVDCPGRGAVTREAVSVATPFGAARIHAGPA